MTHLSRRLSPPGLALCALVWLNAAGAAPIERELHVVATVEATQDWKKNDPKYPGEQWSKGTTTQRYEITTRLRSDGNLEVRNLLDPNLSVRLEAKTIHLARQAKKAFEASGKPFVLPKTPEERAAFTRRMNADILTCNGEAACSYEKQMQYAAIMAAIDNPEALEEEDVPGQYLYFLPYKGCPQKSRVTMTMAIDGVRYNKDADKFVPFKERRSADTVDANLGRSLCSHLLAVLDTKDMDKPMYQETILIPRPIGVTEYTENNHTSREEQPQPMPTDALDWMTDVLRHAKTEGTLSTTLPLALPLNANATWLGLWTGTAKVTMQWSFREVPLSATPAPAAAPGKPVKP
ncbi:MAG: hypothetical protein K0Q76_460 [Panacagrimonas sp.]|nr:hypothetical protein [Panacagrimonas sp.]